MATLQQCNTEWNTDILSDKDISYNKGQYWGWGAEAMSLFNTIVPPSSKPYPWGDCRSGCAGCCGDGFCAAADHSEISNANSNHPGGCNVLFGDGSVKFVKSSLSFHLVVSGHPFRLRSHQRRRLLSPGRRRASWAMTPSSGRAACAAGLAL